MTGPRLMVAAIVAALALPPGASAADLVIKHKAYDAFVQGDAPIVTAQMKGGAVDFIRADVNPPK